MRADVVSVQAISALLIHILKAALQPPPGRLILEVHLLYLFNDKDYLVDKITIVDLKLFYQVSRQSLVEMHLLVSWVLPRRLLHYWARFHP